MSLDDSRCIFKGGTVKLSNKIFFIFIFFLHRATPHRLAAVIAGPIVRWQSVARLGRKRVVDTFPIETYANLFQTSSVANDEIILCN